MSAGAPPQTPLGELIYSAPPDPLAGFKGPTSKGRGREERGRDGRGREGTEGKGSGHPQIFSWIVAYGSL